MAYLFDFVLHIDQHLADLVAWAGPWAIVALALVVFCETGLVVMPFLPGDSLLFAAGALAATGAFDVWVLGASLFVAAVLGDTVNYAVGQQLGRRAATRWIRAEHLARTEAFFAARGGRAIVIARFVPIVRTVAPFVAGAGSMPYRLFVRYNLIGAVLWVAPFVGAGYALGSVPFVQQHFGLLVIIVVVLSVLPLAAEAVRSRRAAPGLVS